MSTLTGELLEGSLLIRPVTLMILLPYDVGSPHLLWRDGETAVISEHAASVIRTYGIGLSSEYLLEDSRPTNPTITYPSTAALNLRGLRNAADSGVFKLSKKARNLMNEDTLTFQEAVRTAFKKHASLLDYLKSDRLVREGALFEISFKADLQHVALSLAIFQDGTFRVIDSSLIPTEDFEPYLTAYGRSLDFVRSVGIQPRV